MKTLFFYLSLCCCFTFTISNKTFAQANNGNATNVDTLIFKAGSYVIQPNDKLEDLLKRLPVIVLDNRGKIFANGEAIDRIFVDGDEFYSDSPVTAARALRADKVDIIKIYWRLADQSSFTGVADKIRQKVINVIMKK